MKNYLDFKRQLEEKHLTAAEKKKREEIAQAIEKKNPNMPMDKKMAIATAQAKKVAEEYEKYVAEMKELGLETEAISEAAWDDILGGVGKYVPKFGEVLKGAKKGLADTVKSAKDKASDLLGLGAKETKPATSAADDIKPPAGTNKPAADDPMGVQGPVVTKPFKDTDAAKEFTQRELDRIQKAASSGSKAADDIKPPAGTNKPVEAPKAAETPAAPKKATQPRDERGRYTSTATKAADDIKPPAGTNKPVEAPKAAETPKLGAADDIKPPSSKLSTAGKVGLGLGGAVAAGAALKAIDSASNDKASANAPAAPSSDDRSNKEPSAAQSSTAEPSTSTKSDDSKTFGQAFAAARKAAAEKGAQSTGRFTWKGKEYQTNVKGEKYVSRSKQTAVGESFDKIPEGSLDEAILMSMSQVKK